GRIGWIPAKAGYEFRMAHVGYIQDDDPSMPIAHIEPVSQTHRMMAPVCIAIPARPFPSRGPLSGHPPSSNFLRPCWILEVDNHHDVADITFKSRREISVPAIECKSVDAFAGGFEKGNLLRLRLVRDIENFWACLRVFFGLVLFIVKERDVSAGPHFGWMNSLRHVELGDR